jgi:hypothetical protein
MGGGPSKPPYDPVTDGRLADIFEEEIDLTTDANAHLEEIAELLFPYGFNRRINVFDKCLGTETGERRNFYDFNIPEAVSKAAQYLKNHLTFEQNFEPNFRKVQDDNKRRMLNRIFEKDGARGLIDKLFISNGYLLVPHTRIVEFLETYYGVDEGVDIIFTQIFNMSSHVYRSAKVKKLFTKKGGAATTYFLLQIPDFGMEITDKSEDVVNFLQIRGLITYEYKNENMYHGVGSKDGTSNLTHDLSQDIRHRALPNQSRICSFKNILLDTEVMHESVECLMILALMHKYSQRHRGDVAVIRLAENRYGCKKGTLLMGTVEQIAPDLTSAALYHDLLSFQRTFDYRGLSNDEEDILFQDDYVQRRVRGTFDDIGVFSIPTKPLYYRFYGFNPKRLCLPHHARDTVEERIDFVKNLSKKMHGLDMYVREHTMIRIFPTDIGLAILLLRTLVDGPHSWFTEGPAYTTYAPCVWESDDYV